MQGNALVKRYGGQTVLNGVSFAFDNCGTVCILGASGVGKSTLLRLLMRLEKPDGGTLTDTPDRFSAVFQDDTLCDGLSALKNVQIFCPNASEEEIKAAFTAVGLTEDDTQKPVRDLSGGMRRRVSIVRAMCAEGTHVFMDEPFKGLDEETRKSVVAFVLSSLNGRGLTVVTHDERDVEDLHAARFEL